MNVCGLLLKFDDDDLCFKVAVQKLEPFIVNMYKLCLLFGRYISLENLQGNAVITAFD